MVYKLYKALAIVKQSIQFEMRAAREDPPESSVAALLLVREKRGIYTMIDNCIEKVTFLTSKPLKKQLHF